MKILLMSFLMLPLFLFNPSTVESSEEMLGDSCTVKTDCNGDGDPDYEGVVDCKYAEDLGDQFEDSCE